jgi:hypothetical protein
MRVPTKRTSPPTHQGNTYFVDAGGNYFVRGTDGYRYPLQQR